MENIKFNNYDVLLQLGFDKDFIDENRRLGLQEQNFQKAKQRSAYMMEYEKQRKTNASQIFEKKKVQQESTILTDDNEEYKYV